MGEPEWSEVRAEQVIRNIIANLIVGGDNPDTYKLHLLRRLKTSPPPCDESFCEWLQAAGFDHESIRKALAEVYREAAAEDGGPAKTGATGGLWRKRGVAGGKYLVQRRDGTVPEWPNFVLGGKDPAAPAALRAYAAEARRLGFAPEYVVDVFGLADEFEIYRKAHGAGDPDGVPRRKDDPATVAKMVKGRNA